MNKPSRAAVEIAGPVFVTWLWAAALLLFVAAPVRGAMSYLTNGVLRIGIDTDRGGTITYLAKSADGRDIINNFDLGRMAQQSYYSGPAPFGTPHPAYPNWAWNPVAAGDVYGYRSAVLQWTNDGAMIYVKRVPKQWALSNVNSECTMEEWISLEDNVVKVRCRLNNNRGDTNFYGAYNQELPALYANPPFTRIFTYNGASPFTGGSLSQIVQAGPPWTSFLATENWSALVDATNWGVGLYHPGVLYTLAGTAGTGSLPEGYTTAYLSPVLSEHLDHNIVYEYEYYLIVGTLGAIRDYVYAHRPPPLPHWHFQKDRQHWVYLNTMDSRFPIAGHLQVNLSSNAPRMLSNAKIWNAADVPTLYVRAKYSATNVFARVFWQNLADGAFGDKSMYLSPVPDGQYHTYAVDLSVSPLYTGTMKQLRFDPAQTAALGEHAEIEYVSAYSFPGDLNRDEKVDFRDFATFAAHWREDRAAGFVGDLDGDRRVGWEDLAVFAKHWLNSIERPARQAGELDGLYYSGGNPVWPAIRLNTNRYVVLANNYGSANQFFGAKADGGVDAIANYGSSWQTFPLVPGTYRALATDYGFTNRVFGANVAGGVDAIAYSNGTWTVAQVNPHDFVSLANVGGAHQFMGVRSDGRLEFTYFDGGLSTWTNYLAATNLYTRVIFDPKRIASVYALRADGGINRVTLNGGVWATTAVDHSRVYVAVAADNTVTDWVYGATAGGLYAIVDTGGGFAATLVNTNSYNALEHITGVSYQLFGARADGTGLDAIYFNGSQWVRYLANPKDYSLLLHDAYNGNLYAAAATLSVP